MIRIHKKTIEKEEIRDNQTVIIEYDEVTEEFISLEQQLSILKKAKENNEYFRKNYENLFEFEHDLVGELGDDNWNENGQRYFKNDEDLLELVESLKFLKILPNKFSNLHNHFKIIFSEIYKRGLDKPEHLDLVNASELNWTRYGKFESSSQYYDFQKKKEIFLQFGKNDFPLQKFEEENLSTFDRELTRLLGENWNDSFSSNFSTDEEKIDLFKGLILLEKFHGNGSSVSENIIVFQELERLNLVTPELLDWTFKNKSDNVYTPFGWARYGHVRSYKEYIDFLDEESLRAKKHNNNEVQNTENKKKIIIEKAKKHKEKLEMTELFNLVLYSKRDEYLKDKSKDILKDIINKNLSFPLFILAEDTIKELIPKLTNLDEENLQKLVKTIPKKSPLHIKELRITASETLLNKNSKF